MHIPVTKKIQREARSGRYHTDTLLIVNDISDVTIKCGTVHWHTPPQPMALALLTWP